MGDVKLLSLINSKVRCKLDLYITGTGRNCAPVRGRLIGTRCAGVHANEALTLHR